MTKSRTISWICDKCSKNVLDGTGSVWTHEPAPDDDPERVYRWSVQHFYCDPELNNPFTFFFNIEDVRTEEQLPKFIARVHSKVWAGRTDLSQLIYSKYGKVVKK